MQRQSFSGNPHPLGVAVFCGARGGIDPVHVREAELLGRGIAERGLRLVYGGGSTGLMGAAAAAALGAGGEVLGVIPEGVFESGVSAGAKHIVTAPNLRERKALMRANSDALLALAGGVGTLDEIVESLMERQLHRHQKPIILVNTGDYWSELYDLLLLMVEKGFLDPSVPTVLALAKDARDALRQVERLVPAAPLGG